MLMYINFRLFFSFFLNIFFLKIRKQAIKDLSTICRDSPEHLNRIADILTQLLQTDDPHESLQVQNSLLAAFRQNPKSIFFCDLNKKRKLSLNLSFL